VTLNDKKTKFLSLKLDQFLDAGPCHIVPFCIGQRALFAMRILKVILDFEFYLDKGISSIHNLY